MAIILKSQPLIDEQLEVLKTQCEKLKLSHQIPNLIVLLVGNDPASLLYTTNKKKFCEKIGAKCDIITLKDSITPEDFVCELKKYMDQQSTNGILIQLPLPKQLSDINLSRIIHPHKDVDGFTQENMYQLLVNKTSNSIIPCTPKGILDLLDYYNLSVAGKSAIVIGRSMIVGKPLAALLTNLNATVTLAHSETKNLKELVRKHQFVFSAIGKPKFLTKDYFDLALRQIVIDIGISYDSSGKLCGDVDFENVKSMVHAISPVPGGVGPMTILSVGKNLLRAHKIQQEGLL